MANQPKGYWKGGHYISLSAKGHWSKWGGGRLGDQQEQLPEWMCQSCSVKQFNILPFFFLEYPSGELVRICALCRHIFIRYELQTFLDLVEKVRRTDLLTSIANLMTLPVRY